MSSFRFLNPRTSWSVTLLIGLFVPFASAPESSLSSERIVLQLAGDYLTADQGSLSVPLWHDKPDGAMIRIKYIRLYGKKTNTPAAFYLSGGPGIPGTRVATPGRKLSSIAKTILEHTDFILIDQRGTGKSLPNLSCPESVDLPLWPTPTEAMTFNEIKRASEICVEYWRNRNVDLAAFNTEESARDLEALRQALELDKIVLIGASYGSHLAFSYMRQFGTVVNRAILAAVEGPNHTYKLPLAVDGLLRSLDDMASSPRGQPLRTLAQTVLNELTASSVRFQFDMGNVVEIGAFDFQRVLARATGLRQVQDSFPNLITRLTRGDYLGLAKAVAKLRSESIHAMRYTMDCASGASKSRLELIRQQAQRSIVGTANSFPFPEICQVWGIEPLPARFRSRLSSSVPTLLFSGGLDARTPTSNAMEVMMDLENSYLVVDPMNWHDWCRRKECIEILKAFFIDKNLNQPRILVLSDTKG